MYIYHRVREIFHPGARFELHDIDVPQQDDIENCGVFVCAFAEIVLRAGLAATSDKVYQSCVIWPSAHGGVWWYTYI